MDNDKNHEEEVVDKGKMAEGGPAMVPATPTSATSSTSAASLDSPVTPMTPKGGANELWQERRRIARQQQRQQQQQQQQQSPQRTFEHIQAEHQYLFANLHRQDARVRTLLTALSTVRQKLTQNQEASTSKPSPTVAEARRLRKNAGFIQSKIAAAEQQEQLIVVRLGEVAAELQGRQWLAQMQQQRQQQYQQQQAWMSGASGVVTAGAPQGYFPQQVPQTPYLAPYDIWTPDQPHHQESRQESQQHPTPSFVVSPVTPAIHAMMPASPVSPLASLSGEPGGGYMSPMSPLAPVFEPGSSSSYFLHTIPQAEIGHGGITPVADPSSSSEQESSLDHVGMHYAYEDNAAAAAAVDDNDNEDIGDSDISDTAFLPPDVRQRRLSQSSARPSQVKQKRMSLPPVRFEWPGVSEQVNTDEENEGRS